MGASKKNSTLATIGLALLIISVVLASRLLLVDFPNFKPVTAILLLSGMLFRSWKLRLGVPLLGTMLADLCLGMGEVPLMFGVYASLGLNAWLGVRLREKWVGQSQMGNRLIWGVGTVGMANLQFFLVTNFAAWAWTPWYDKNLAGLWTCLVNAIPFWKYSLAGDLVFGLVPLCGLALAEASARARHDLAQSSLARARG